MTGADQAFTFTLSLDGAGDDNSAGFSEASGLVAEIATASLREGCSGGAPRHLPGATRHGTLALRRGRLPADSELVAWLKGALEGGSPPKIETRALVLALMGETGARIRTWRFASAYPVKMRAAAMPAPGGDIAIESLDLSYSEVTPS